jgi:NADPH2:quinone reductase
MKAIEIASPGGPDVLRWVDRPEPRCGAGEVLIRVASSGVNRPDGLQRKGLYPAPEGASDIPGLEVAGTVVAGDALAMADAGVEVGQTVCALVAGGGYAQFCAAPVAQCLPIPKGWSPAQAASLPETTFTVWSNVFDRAQLMPGECLLVHGGSSGIGVTAIQMAKAHGAKVVVTVGSDEKAAACLGLGADHAINYRAADFVEEVKRLTSGQGVHVVLDMVAGSYVARNLQCLAMDGRAVIIAVQGGTQAQMDAGLVLRRRLTVSGSTLRARSLEFKAAIARALRAKVWPWLEQGRIKPVIHQLFEAKQAAQAHALMESSTHIGKLVLTW